MKKEDLIALGIADDVADKIFALHGKDLEKFKTASETAKTEIETFKTQLTEANKQIEDFKKLDIEGVKKAADDYKTKFEQAQTESASQLANLKFDHALESALATAKARNPKAVTALLSRDALKLNEDGSILGLNEQLEKIKTDNDYLFSDGKEPPRIVTGGNSQPITGNAFTDAARRGAKLPVEQGK